MNLGDRLRLAREKLGYTQTEVYERPSKKINNKTLSRYENGGTEPDVDTLKLLASLYGVTTDWLTGMSDEQLPKSNQHADPDIQFIMRARKELSPEAYEQFIRATKEMKKAFEDRKRKE